jgi:hypothetical protein
MANSRITRSFAAVAAMAGIMGFAGEIAADVDLSGSWSGGGSVTFSGGSKEKARCRATYAKSGVTSYSVNATCATPSGTVTQTASVKRSGPSSFSGSFYNAAFDTSGSIHVSISGNSQSVTLASVKASASLRLSR